MEKPLRKKQKKLMIKKIEVYLAAKIEEMVNGTWTQTEIDHQYGIPISRQSEMKNPDKYPNRGLNEKLLRKSIIGGLITVNEIKANIKLTPAEQAELDLMAVEEEAGEIRRAGFDPAAILREWRKAKGLLKD